METTAQSIAQSYDDVPYESRPFPQSHPARSAAIAKLFGLKPPSINTARVLELGCAAGGNLIPMAANFAGATFVGVDLSSVQIEQGHKRIVDLGLKNIDLRHQSICDITNADGRFDYVICHGVYSWVPASVRSAIMRVCRENLSDDGIAYVSYNVFPGWRLRGALRDAILFHVEGETEPRRRVAMAREMLGQLSEASDVATPYGQMLRKEVAAFANQQDHYIAHEYLELNNEPCYVADFLKEARAGKLEFLTEANFNHTIAETYGPQNASLLRSLSGNRLDRMEQYIDFMSGRTFRQSLLVREEAAASIQRTLDASRMDGLHVHSHLNPVAVEKEGQYVFADAAGRTLSTPSQFVRDAIEMLGKGFPVTATLETLAARVAAPLPATPAQLAALRDALFKMTIAGLCDVATEAVPVSATPGPRPQATPMARADALAGREWTTNGRHETVVLNLVQKAVLPAIDGSRDHARLRQVVADAVTAGNIVFWKSGAPLSDTADIEASIDEHVENALQTLARSGLLVA